MDNTWVFCLNGSLLAIAIVLTASIKHYSNGLTLLKHPESILPKLTVICLDIAYLPLITSLGALIIAICMVYKGDNARLFLLWKVLCLMTIILIALILMGVFLPWFPNACSYR